MVTSWYLQLQGGGRFSFDLPAELFNQYAEHGILSEQRALDLKADYLFEIQAVIKTFLQQRERALQDQLLHDFTFRFEHEDTYITCMFAPAKRTHELKRRLAAYCPLKKYQMKSNLWIGLACIPDGPSVLQGSIVLHSPWEYDAEMERRVASSFPAAEKQ